jgi:predicted nucleotidyltransferase
MKLSDNTRVPQHPYPELREVLNTFVAEVQAELAENLVGIYLVGSLASGDFDLDSDVDFLVVINTELTPENRQNLQDIQRKVHQIDCYPARHLEGSYITIEDLNDWGTVGEKELYYFDNGSTTFEWSAHDNQWHVRWILRERGIALLGPAPETLLPPIPTDELLGEMKASMHIILQFFAESLDQPLNFFNSQFGQSFVVLTCCRILHTLHTGEVQSKKAGALWAQKNVDPAWRKFIDRAWADREGVRFGGKIGQRADETLLDQTLEFIQYALAQTDKIPTKS